jgi:hypothetical protein
MNPTLAALHALGGRPQSQEAEGSGERDIVEAQETGEVASWREKLDHLHSLIRRRQRSSATVQPFCFTFSQRLAGPPA